MWQHFVVVFRLAYSAYQALHLPAASLPDVERAWLLRAIGHRSDGLQGGRGVLRIVC